MTRHLEHLARLGLGAQGVVYLLVGWFAMVAAYGGARPMDSKGALAQLLEQPQGQVLLGVVALGLLCYAAWRAAQGALDLDHCGHGAKGIAMRGAHLVSAAIHVGLAIYAGSLALGLTGPASGDSGDSSAQDWTVWLLAQPLGRWAVAFVGVAVAGAGVAQWVKAYRASFCKRIQADPDAIRLIRPIGRLGHAARGVVFVMVGAFFLLAAWQSDASESGGLAQALRQLQDQGYGPWLLGAVAAGLFLFGVFCEIKAFYRRIEAAEASAKLHALKRAAH